MLVLLLLLYGVAVGAALCRFDQLVNQALSDRLDVPEGGLAGAGAQGVNGGRVCAFITRYRQITKTEPR